MMDSLRFFIDYIPCEPMHIMIHYPRSDILGLLAEDKNNTPLPPVCLDDEI